MRPFWYFNVSVGSGEKSFAFQDCAWIVILLHTERTENPHTPQAHPSASNFHKYHSDISQTPPRHPPDIPQTPPDVSREHDMPTDDNRCQGTDARHTQTAPVCVLKCLSVSVCVCWCLLVCCVPWRCHGVIWGMSGGCLKDIWLVFIEIGGALMCLGGMWVLSLTVWSKNTI